MKTTIKVEDASIPHVVFAWIPVLARSTLDSSFCSVWLEPVTRKLVSVQGNIFWSYTYTPKTK